MYNRSCLFPRYAEVQSGSFSETCPYGISCAAHIASLETCCVLKVGHCVCVCVWRRCGETCCIHNQGKISLETLPYTTRLHDVMSHNTLIFSHCRGHLSHAAKLVCSIYRVRSAVFPFGFVNCKPVSNSKIRNYTSTPFVKKRVQTHSSQWSRLQ